VLDTTAPNAAPPLGSSTRGRRPLAAIGWPAIVAVASVAVLGLLSPSYSLASTVLIYAIAVLGCNLLLGYTGLLSFGQGIFFGVGAYSAGLAFIHLDVQAPAGLVVATLMGMITATVVGSLCILRRGVYFVMLTFAFAAMFGYLVYLFSDVTGGENGLRGFPAMTLGVLGAEAVALDRSIRVFLLIALCFVAVYLFLTQVIRSRFGATLMAIRENEDRAAAIGYNTTLFKLLAFTISGLVTGLAGGLYAIYLGTVPDTALQLDISTTILVMTILGGTGSLYGSFLGATIYLVLSDYLSQVWDRWQILLAVALIAIVLYLRGGVWGALELLGTELRHRVRRRRSVERPTAGSDGRDASS
jgi:branched-chain amino acid transport system permease protein